jgi:hypothetical protein
MAPIPTYSKCLLRIFMLCAQVPKTFLTVVGAPSPKVKWMILDIKLVDNPVRYHKILKYLISM